MLKQALSLHQQGEFAKARKIYEKLLKQDPQNHEALHLLGALELSQGQPARAQELIEQAIALVKHQAHYYGNLANAHMQQNHPEQALACLDEGLLHCPQDADLHYNRANVLSSLKQHEQALQDMQRCLQINPRHAEAWYNRGNLELQLEQAQAAVESYTQAVQCKPDYFKAWYNLGNAWRALHNDEAAVESFSRALALKPDYAKAYYNRGNAYQSLKQHAQALQDYEACLAIKPNDDVALVNKGNSLISQLDYSSALQAYDQAIANNPTVAAYHNNKGNALLGLQDTQQALDAYGKALEMDPLEKDAHFNRAICYLLMGDWLRGFEEYEWRWQTEDLAAARPSFPQPAWDGQDIAGKRVMLYCEQGLGDTIQFVRYASMVADLGAEVILGVQPPLLELMRGLQGKGQLVTSGLSVTDFDYHCALLSLPRVFKTQIETVPAPARYLFSDAARVQKWRQRLGVATRPRIGLAWSGRPEHKNDQNRSIALATFVQGLPPGYDYVCLQKELRESDRAALAQRSDIRFLGDELQDFADTAAICEDLDQVISVDTSVAHLAAAMGKPVWILLPSVPDWRWMLDRSDSPWYPSARLFRQSRLGDWSGVLDEVATQLQTQWPLTEAAPSTLASHAEVPVPAPSAQQDGFKTEGNRLPVLMNWQAGSNFGWGVVGLNLMMQWAQDDRIQPLMSYEIEESHVSHVDPLRQRLMRKAIAFSNHFCKTYEPTKGRVQVSFPVIQALGNGFQAPSLIRGSKTFGRAVFEDTQIAPFATQLDVFDELLVISNWNRALIEAQSRKPVHLVFEGVDPALFFPGPRSGMLDPNRFYVFSGGKIEFRKAQDLVLRAFAIFARRHPEAVLVTSWQSPFAVYSAGFQGTLKVPVQLSANKRSLDIQRWAIDNGIAADQIWDIGGIPNQMMPTVLREMHCSVQVSRAEGGTNMPAKEAMACGIPVILAQNTGVLDLIDGDNCLPIVHQRPVPAEQARSGTEGWGESDVYEIVAALEKLYTDTALRRKIGQRGAEWILKKNRTWSSHAHQLKRVILG